MPLVKLQLFDGRTVDEKRKVAAAVTKAIATGISVPEEHVTIVFDEMKEENYSIGGTLRIDKK